MSDRPRCACGRLTDGRKAVCCTACESGDHLTGCEVRSYVAGELPGRGPVMAPASLLVEGNVVGPWVQVHRGEPGSVTTTRAHMVPVLASVDLFLPPRPRPHG